MERNWVAKIIFDLIKNYFFFKWMLSQNGVKNKAVSKSKRSEKLEVNDFFNSDDLFAPNKKRN